MLRCRAGDDMNGAALQKPPTIIAVIAMKIGLSLHQGGHGDRFNIRHTYDEDQSDLHHNDDDGG